VAETLRMSALLVLLGVLAMMILCHALMFWQKERTPRSFAQAMMYVGMFALLATAGLGVGPAGRAAAYLFLIIAMSVCTVYRWREYIEFQRAKNVVIANEAAEHTLGDLVADDGPNAALIATKKTTGVDRG